MLNFIFLVTLAVGTSRYVGMLIFVIIWVFSFFNFIYKGPIFNLKSQLIIPTSTVLLIESGNLSEN